MKMIIYLTLLLLLIISTSCQTLSYSVYGPWSVKYDGKLSDTQKQNLEGYNKINEYTIDGITYLSALPAIIISRDSFGAQLTGFNIIDITWKDTRTAFILLSTKTSSDKTVFAKIAMHFLSRNRVYCTLESIDTLWADEIGPNFMFFGVEYTYIRGERINNK
jgi:hypothetical protein